MGHSRKEEAGNDYDRFIDGNDGDVSDSSSCLETCVIVGMTVHTRANPQYERRIALSNITINSAITHSK